MPTKVVLQWASILAWAGVVVLMASGSTVIDPHTGREVWPSGRRPDGSSYFQLRDFIPVGTDLDNNDEPSPTHNPNQSFRGSSSSAVPSVAADGIDDRYWRSEIVEEYSPTTLSSVQSLKDPETSSTTRNMKRFDFRQASKDFFKTIFSWRKKKAAARGDDDTAAVRSGAAVQDVDAPGQTATSAGVVPDPGQMTEDDLDSYIMSQFNQRSTRTVSELGTPGRSFLPNLSIIPEEEDDCGLESNDPTKLSSGTSSGDLILEAPTWRLTRSSARCQR